MKILAIAAHPDDIEFGCGGLMIKEAEKGTEIKYVICSLGEAGTNGTPDQRKQEAMASAEFAKAQVEFLNMGGDCRIEYKPQNAIALAKIIREFKPNVVLTQQLKENQHPDHSVIARLTRDACRFARYGGLEELKSLDIHRLDGLYYFPSSADSGGQPDVIIDVSEVYDKWVQAMNCHKSQMKTTGYIDLISSKAAALGTSVGVKYAIALWKNEPMRLDYISDLTLSSRNY